MFGREHERCIRAWLAKVLMPQRWQAAEFRMPFLGVRHGLLNQQPIADRGLSSQLLAASSNVYR
ncbi:hypothetical protein [Novipirellula sp.]|uniref:hypothetical protein n=1 Tax=Novipirellula sp. TaxID=2795430 RepID=UPI0035615C47